MHDRRDVRDVDLPLRHQGGVVRFSVRGPVFEHSALWQLCSRLCIECNVPKWHLRVSDRIDALLRPLH
jgi:hypothetical protein